MTRNNKGQFAVGNPGGPGRHARPTEKAYLERLTTKLTLDKWDKIVDKAISDAIAGLHPARVWLAEYAIGRPSLTIELMAQDQALLSDLLRQCETRGLSAGALFEAMMATIAETTPVEVADDEL